MKIRIKKKLNEGKGADIIARGLKVNLLSDVSKKIFNKFGGFEKVMQGDEEIINQVIEMIMALGSGDKQSMKNDSNIFKEFAKSSELNVLKAKKEYEKIRDNNFKEYSNFLRSISRGGTIGITAAELDPNAMQMKMDLDQEEKKYLSDINNLQKKVDLYNDIAEKLLQV